MSNISSSLTNKNRQDDPPQYEAPFLGDQGAAFIQADRNRRSVYGSGVHNSVYHNVSVTNEAGKEPDGSLTPGTAVLGANATMISAQIYHGGTLQVNNRGLLWGGTVSCNGTVTLLGGTMNGKVGVGDSGGNNQILGGTVLVGNGGVVANGTAWGAWVNGVEGSPTTAYLSVGAGGTANGERIWQGASADFGAGARGNTIIDQGGTVVIHAGAAVSTLVLGNDKHYYSGKLMQSPGEAGQATVMSGGTLENAQVGNSGILTVNGTASYISVNKSGGGAGTELVGENGISIDGIVSSGGVVSVAFGGTVTGGILTEASTAFVESGATIMDLSLNPTSEGGTGGVISLGLGGKAFLSPEAGGTVIMGGAAENDGLILQNLSAAASEGATTIVTTEIKHFDETQNGFPPDGYVPPIYDPTTQTWRGGDSDGIVLAGLKRSDITGVYSENSSLDKIPEGLQHYLTGSDAGNYALIQTKSGGWIVLHIDGIGDRGVIGIDQNGDLVFEVCYLEGSQILTPHGYQKVENLYPGDLVEVGSLDGTRTGKSLPLKWVGKKRLWVNDENPDLPPDVAGYAICILKDAFDSGIPVRDLWVTPEHCFLFEGKFVPARMLVNGKSIFYDDQRTSYIYYHLETDPHAILIAEGAFSESYLDTGNRANFFSVLEPHTEGTASLLRFPYKTQSLAQPKDWQEAAAPLMTSRSFVEPLWQKLAERAGLASTLTKDRNALGKAITYESNLALFIKGEDGLQERLICKSKSPQHNGDCYVFKLPESHLVVASELILSSSHNRPCDVVGPYLDDRRELGVLVTSISLVTAQAIYSPNYWQTEVGLEGWANVENVPMRWTAGHAAISLPYSWEGEAELHIEILAQGPYLVTPSKDNFKKTA